MLKFFLPLILATSTCYGWGIPTFLPARGQKLLVAAAASYTRNAADVTGLYHFGLQLELPVTDAGQTFSGLISNMDVVYPFLGNVLGSQKFNYVNASTFTFVDVGSGTFNSNGYAANGTTQYLDTGFNVNTSAGSFKMGVSVDERTDTTSSGGSAVGAYDFSTYLTIAPMRTGTPGNSFAASDGGLVSVLGTAASTVGFWTTNRVSSTQVDLLKSGVSYGLTGNSVGTHPNAKVFIGALSLGGSGGWSFTPLNTDFVAVHENLVAATTVELFNIVSNLKTAWGR